MAQRRSPVRTCVGCRGRSEVADLVRVVAESGDVGSVLVVDPGRRRAGRGSSIHPDPGCLAVADRRRVWSRALRVPAPVDDTALRDYVKSEPSRADTSATELRRK